MERSGSGKNYQIFGAVVAALALLMLLDGGREALLGATGVVSGVIIFCTGTILNRIR